MLTWNVNFYSPPREKKISSTNFSSDSFQASFRWQQIWTEKLFSSSDDKPKGLKKQMEKPFTLAKFFHRIDRIKGSISQSDWKIWCDKTIGSIVLLCSCSNSITRISNNFTVFAKARSSSLSHLSVPTSFQYVFRIFGPRVPRILLGKVSTNF